MGDLLERVTTYLPRPLRRRTEAWLARRPQPGSTQKAWLPSIRVERDGLFRVEDGGPHPWRGIVRLETAAPRSENQETQELLARRMGTALTLAASGVDLHWLTESRPGGAEGWVDARRRALADGSVSLPLRPLAEAKLAHVRERIASGEVRQAAVHVSVTGRTRDEAWRRRRHVAEAFNGQGVPARELDSLPQAAPLLAHGYRWSRFAAPSGHVVRYTWPDGTGIEVDDTGGVTSTIPYRGPRAALSEPEAL